MLIHDHFDGSAHCVECHGWFRLTGQSLALTEPIRNLLEAYAVQDEGKLLPSKIAVPLAKLTGSKRAKLLQERAISRYRSRESAKCESVLKESPLEPRSEVVLDQFESISYFGTNHGSGAGASSQTRITPDRI
jgi:hypothetical protein